MQKTVKKLSLIALAIAAIALTSASVANADTVYSAAISFESAYNAAVTTGTSGQFSFGFAGTSVGTPITAYTGTTTADGGLVHFLTTQPPSSDLVPSVFHNTTGSTSTFFSVSLDPNQLAFHPGSAGQYSVISFTAPTAGIYNVAAAFEGSDDGVGTTTDVHFLQNSTELHSGNVNGFHGIPVDFSGSYNLAANDVLSFWVGTGGNGYGSDSTGAVGALTITAVVPLPASGWTGFTLLGILGLSRLIRRRTFAAA